MIRMMVGLMGREAFRSISSRVIPMMDSNTMARSNWFHLKSNTVIEFGFLRFVSLVSLAMLEPEYLSLKKRRRPKAMSLRMASMTKMMVKT